MPYSLQRACREDSSVDMLRLPNLPSPPFSLTSSPVSRFCESIPLPSRPPRIFCTATTPTPSTTSVQYSYNAVFRLCPFFSVVCASVQQKGGGVHTGQTTCSISEFPALHLPRRIGPLVAQTSLPVCSSGTPGAPRGTGILASALFGCLTRRRCVWGLWATVTRPPRPHLWAHHTAVFTGGQGC